MEITLPSTSFSEQIPGDGCVVSKAGFVVRFSKDGIIQMANLERGLASKTLVAGGAEGAGRSNSGL